MIDIYEINDTEEYLLSITDSEYFVLENVVRKFEKITGFNIGEYGDLVLTNGAIDNLLSIMNKEIINKCSSDLHTINKFYKVFFQVKTNGGRLAFYGD